MSTFMIKIIALAAMVIDHSGHVIQNVYSWDLGLPLRCIGRIAFPLYAFLIGQGCRHTKDIKKYLGRLLLFAFISEIPYDLFRSNIGKPAGLPIGFMDFSSQNVFFTLFLGGLAVALHIHSKMRYEKPIAIAVSFAGFVSSAMIAGILSTDYGILGVAMIYLPFVAADNMGSEKAYKFLYTAFLAICIGLIYYSSDRLLLLSAMASLIFVLLYNGTRGRGIKWFFYVIYPVHLLALFSIWFFFLRVGELII